MDTKKYIYLQLLSKGGPIIHHGDVCRFTNVIQGGFFPEEWKEIKDPIELLIALKGHRLLEGGMLIDEYEAFMEKIKKGGK